MDISRKNGNRPLPPIEHRFQTGNPGGSAPKGKRITTWMAEFGEKSLDELPKIKSKAFDKLPINAQIALRRIYRANEDDNLALLNTQYVEPRNLAPEGGALPTSAIEQVAAAILALKAAGVSLRRDEKPSPIDVTPIHTRIAETEEEQKEQDDDQEEDEQQRAKRLRRGRA